MTGATGMTAYVNDGPNQVRCERCGAATLVRVVVTRAKAATEMTTDNTPALCTRCADKET